MTDIPTDPTVRPLPGLASPPDLDARSAAAQNLVDYFDTGTDVDTLPSSRMWLLADHARTATLTERLTVFQAVVADRFPTWAALTRGQCLDAMDVLDAAGTPLAAGKTIDPDLDMAVDFAAALRALVFAHAMSTGGALR